MKKKNILPFAVLFLLSLFFIWKLSGGVLYKYLSYSKPIVGAEVLLIEGWINQAYLDSIPQEFVNGKYDYLVTTGILCPDYFIMHMDGDLVFTINDNLFAGNHQLKVNLYGTPVDSETSKFEVYLNQTKMGANFTRKRPHCFYFPFADISRIDSVIVKFVNDAVKGKQHRNLYIKSISIDDKSYAVNDTHNIYRVCAGTYTFYLGNTQAEKTRQFFIHSGIPAKKVIGVNIYSYGESKTFQTARNTYHVLDSILGRPPKSIKIISMFPHTRRTYHAYKKCFPETTQIGIEGIENVYPYSFKHLRNIREIFGIIYIELLRKRQNFKSLPSQ